jgi:hypothetical protein
MVDSDNTSLHDPGNPSCADSSASAMPTTMATLPALRSLGRAGKPVTVDSARLVDARGGAPGGPS